MRLNSEQRKIVEYDPSGHIQVKGVAGSGKTTVCVHRVPFLLSHYCYEQDDRILLVTYNRTLSNYLEHQYNYFKEGIYQQSLFQPDESKLEITNVDKLMYQYYMKFRHRHKLNVKIAETHEARPAMQKAIFLTKEKYPDVKILSPKNLRFFEKEIEWIKACGIDDLETYQNINRLGRASGIKGTPQKLLKNSLTRESVFSLMRSYDEILKKEGYIDFKTMNQWALEEVRRHRPRYTHVLIDECQDLTKVQLEFLKSLYNDRKNYSSIMFVADNTQSIYSHSWLGKGRSFTSIGFDMKGRSRILSKNYRTTAEIAKAAFSIIENDEEINTNIDYVKPSMIDRHGHAPIYKQFRNFEEQLIFLEEQIRKLQTQYSLSDICVVAKNNNVLYQTRDYLQSKNIKAQMISKKRFDFLSESVRLTTMYSIKGLEFKVVFLIDLNEGVIPGTNVYLKENDEVFDSDEKRLFYVGMTRANELLFMSSSSTPSKFIKEIDVRLLRNNMHCELRPYYKVPIQDYKFRNEIIDLHSNEEMIRQWMIHEVLESYGYYEEMLSIEHPVQSFSRTGYVDLCINVFMNNQKIPYIFFEFKAMNVSLELGLKQLQTYMESEQTVEYGVLSNGLETIIINREGEIVNDIPFCQAHFLPNFKKKLRYIDFSNDAMFTYLKDHDENEIEIIDEEKEVYLDSSQFVLVPNLENLQSSISLASDYSDNELLPVDKSWCINPKDTFFLEAYGDSMIDVGIHDGDLVLVHKQNYAEQGDIIVVSVNDEVMIKEYLPIGSEATLISRNKEYEAINMHIDDIHINAKVLGVLQR